MKKLILILLLAVSALISKAQTLSAAADTAFAHQKYDQAFNLYSEIVKAEPANLKALRRRGFCMMNFKDQELGATRFFAEALAVDPKDPASNYYMGVVFMDAAKDAKIPGDKSDFKAKAALYLNKAVKYGNEDAKAAIKDLNGI